MRPLPVLANISLIGNKHVNRGTPCEDASISVTKNGVSVVCVADGAGGSRYTHARFGAQCAVKCVADLLTSHFDAFYFENRESVCRSILVTAVHSAMADLLVEHELDSLERLSCTLLFVAVKGDLVLAGHIGDGLICRVSPQGLAPLTLPANGENASSTYFITFPNAQEYLRFIKTTTDNTHAFVLMSDGVEDMVYDASNQLVRPVVARLAELAAQGKMKAEEALTATIQEFVVDASQNSDDCSVGILYLPGTDVPDFSLLSDSKDRFERDFADTMRSVQTELIPKVKHAQEIISKINCQNAPNSDKLKSEKVSGAKSADEDDEPSKTESADTNDTRAEEGGKSSEDERETKPQTEDNTVSEREKRTVDKKMVPLWAFLLVSFLLVVSLIILAMLGLHTGAV